MSHFWRSLWEKLEMKLNFSSAYHPQTNGQIENLALPQAEFAYNWSRNRTTGLSHFEIVYSRNPSRVLDLAPIMAEHLRGIHEQVKLSIQDSYTEYKAQEVLASDRFPAREYNKLKESKIRPCEVLQKINDNAYRLCLPIHLKTSDVFNVKHLSTCFVESDEATVNSRASSFQPEVTDVGGFESSDGKQVKADKIAQERATQ
ncbi:uncharacterized protein LOC111404628 [Olea europaea var. sylvestris]|uniref:uncharacterized protein LOC111404628 n=1 Tax=Olea europaea var. sylvestris TaxID=158386 RepID=UPI000C1D2556|nr:uncharacterized protein LOC111404628 [Olea europaea var. sylvestris]